MRDEARQLADAAQTDSRPEGETKMNDKRGKLNMLKTILTGAAALLMLLLLGNVDAARAQTTNCVPTLTVTDDPAFPGIFAFNTTTSGLGSVTVDHVNAGVGLQSLTVVGTPMNATVTIPPFTPGTTAPVTVGFTRTNPNLPVDFTLRAQGGSAAPVPGGPVAPAAIFIRARCAATCTPTTMVTEGDLFPGGLVSFTVTSGSGSVTVDHVNSGTGLQQLLVEGVATNANVTIPPFTPGTFAPVTVTFTRINPNLPVDFILRASSTFHAIFIRVQCAAPNTQPVAQCSNVTVTLDPGATTANADINDGSFDPDGDPLTLMYNPPGPYGAGQTVVTLTVDDGKGAMDSCMGTVTVLYRFRFDTFFSPFRQNRLNPVDAGSDVSVIFSLSGFKGTNVYAAPPASQRINCATRMPIGAIQPIMTTVNYDPIYNAGFDVYSTTWNTPVNFAGTCRRLFLFLNDGTTQTLDFRFR